LSDARRSRRQSSLVILVDQSESDESSRADSRRARCVVLWNTAAMAKLDTHIIGIPDWVDVMVETTEQREALMSFYSSLHGWTWKWAARIWATTRLPTRGASVMGLGQGPVVTARWCVLLDRRHQRLGRNRGRVGRDGLHGPMEVPGAGIMALSRTRRVPCTDSGKRASSRASASPTRPMHRGGTTTRPMTGRGRGLLHDVDRPHVIEPSPGCGSSTSVSSGSRASQKIRCLSAGSAVELHLRRRNARGGARQDPQARWHHRARRDAGTRKRDLRFY